MVLVQIAFIMVFWLAGLEEYNLRPGFLYATRSPEDIHMIDAYSPEEVVEMIMLKKEPEKCLSPTSGIINILSEHLIISYKLSLDMDDGNMSTKFEALPLSSRSQVSVHTSKNTIKLSKSISFRLIISNKWVCHNPSLGTFNVRGTGGTSRAVKVFPAEVCSYPSTSRCYHIIAARFIIGLSAEDVKQKIYLTQLRNDKLQDLVIMMSHLHQILQHLMRSN